jgi:uncharacterized protein (TIGR02246 family)
MTTDQQALHDIVKHLESAWNASDSKAWTSPFAADATFINIYGGQLDGRAAIEVSHRVIFDTIYKGSRLTFTVRDVRMLRPDVAVVWTRGLVVTAQGTEVDSRPTLILVKDEGNWQIVAVQNTRISDVPSAAQAAAKVAT